MIRRILLLGKDGQVGTALYPRLLELGPVTAHNRETCDLGNARQLRDVFNQARPDLVINAAAYTAVDRAETEPDLCHRINAEAPGILAEEANRSGAALIHYSTDYVFDGTKATPYLEDDAPSPLNVYGQSKLAGDLAVAAHTQNYTILRISWVYGPTGRNFARTILKLALERDELRVVADQFGAPTSTDLIADVTTKIVERFYMPASREATQSSDDALSRSTTSPAHGVFNVAPSGRISWHGYALALIREAKSQGWPTTLPEERIIPISAREYPTPAARPDNSVLDTTKVQTLLGVDFPSWQTPLGQLVTQLLQTTR